MDGFIVDKEGPQGLFVVFEDDRNIKKPGTVRANDQKLWYTEYMRRERITHAGAYHHVMNRGYDGNDIFVGNMHKSHFLDYLEESAKRMKIRIFAYCIMDNHYHLVLENSRSLEWFHKESYEIRKDDNPLHYAIITPNNCIDVISSSLPKVEWLCDYSDEE